MRTRQKWSHPGLQPNATLSKLAKDGNEGLEHLRMVEYDIVLLDWDLPGMSGYELLRHFRASGNRTPVIMLTAKSKVEDKEAGAGWWRR